MGNLFIRKGNYSQKTFVIKILITNFQIKLAEINYRRAVIE